MMRQAGRYLPEYREIRSEYSFRDAISTPEVAIEISLQPWERFRPDGVVMYSDILPTLELLEFSFHLESGVGPVIDTPVMEPGDVSGRARRSAADELSYVKDILDGLNNAVNDRAAVIGFVGGPVTLAAYAIEGEPARNFMALRRFRYEYPNAFSRFLDDLAEAIIDFARFQSESGADVVQLFDTYAGLLSEPDLRTFVLPTYRRIFEAIEVPTIIFARNMNNRLDILDTSGADIVSLDWTEEIGAVRTRLGDRPVQGNLDPATLFAPPKVIHDRTIAIIESAGESGHILNLGHGVHKSTPVGGVEAFFEAAQSVDR